MKKERFFYQKSKDYKQKHNARALCIEALYQYGFLNVAQEDLLVFSWFGKRNLPNKETAEYYQILLKGVFSYIQEIDKMIQEFAITDKSKMLPIDKAILRFSIYSLLYEKDMPHTILINEAIELTKEYSGVDAYKFVNGVLDSVYKKYVRPDSKDI